MFLLFGNLSHAGGFHRDRFVSDPKVFRGFLLSEAAKGNKSGEPAWHQLMIQGNEGRQRMSGRTRFCFQDGRRKDLVGTFRHRSRL